MSKRYIDTTPSDYAQALNELEGYPREATHRGANCPPAPFGRTEGYLARMLAVDGTPTGPLVVASDAVLDRHHGRMARGVTILRDLGVPLPDAVPVDVGRGRP